MLQMADISGQTEKTYMFLDSTHCLDTWQSTDIETG